MSEKNRLAIKICNATQKTNFACKEAKCVGKGLCAYCSVMADDLLANGGIFPPCKVGDTVYFLERHPERLGGTKINTAEVVSMKLKVSYKGMNIWLFVTYRDIRGNDTCGEIMYGKTAFLTKEEAEAELQKRGKENG